jgi:hypothetical protein
MREEKDKRENEPSPHPRAMGCTPTLAAFPSPHPPPSVAAADRGRRVTLACFSPCPEERVGALLLHGGGALREAMVQRGWGC